MGKREERVGWGVGGGVSAENPPTLPLLGHLPPGNLPLAELRGHQVSKSTSPSSHPALCGAKSFFPCHPGLTAHRGGYLL